MIPALLLLFYPFPYDPTPGLPPLSDLDRFPSSEVVYEQFNLLDDHLTYLEELRQTAAGPGFRRQVDAWMEETRQLRAIWDILRGAQSTYWTTPDEDRRIELGKLRELLGECRYQGGMMPPLLPRPKVERMQPVKD